MRHERGGEGAAGEEEGGRGLREEGQDTKIMKPSATLTRGSGGGIGKMVVGG